MKFFCVTPCLNSEQTIERTVRSIVEQTVFKSSDNYLYYIICDGLSSDNTVGVVKKFIDNNKLNNNIKVFVISEKDKGMYDAIAKGFDLSPVCDVYSYLNSGDYYSPYAFEIVSSVFNDCGVRFLTGANVYYNENGYMVNFFIPIRYKKELLLKGFYGKILPFVQQESTFWGNEMHEMIDTVTFRELKYAGDYYLWKTFIKKSNLYIVHAWLGGFSKHENQLSVINYNDYIDEMNILSEKYNLKNLIESFFELFILYFPESVKRKYFNNVIVYDNLLGKYKIIKK
nr:glycosyltransferase [uncultured Desulfobulbus sp.]